MTREALFTAAVLACGDGAAVSHAHAAELLDIGPEASGPIEISLPGKAGRHDGIKPHRRRAFQATRCNDIAVTTVTQTLVDMAPRLSRADRETMIGKADQRRLTNPEKLRGALDRIPRQPGLAILKQTLDRRTFVLTHTELERLFVPIALEAGFSPPSGQHRVGRHRVDFIWPELRLIVEADSLTYHRTPAQQAADLVRDHANSARGLTTLRFTHEQVKYEPGYVRSTLAKVRRRPARR